MYIDFNNWEYKKIKEMMDYKYFKGRETEIIKNQRDLLFVFIKSVLLLRDKGIYFNYMKSKNISKVSDIYKYNKESISLKDIQMLFSHPVILFNYTYCLKRVFKHSNNKEELEIIENCCKEVVKYIEGVNEWNEIPYRSLTNILKRYPTNAIYELEKILHELFNRLDSKN